MKRKSVEPSVRVGAVAKAELIAKTTYERKRTTTEVIPPDVTRAKAHAWLDLISPITEWAGLKGDKLRRKRELLRVQQDETLHTIISKAVEQLKGGDQQSQSVPNKFLIPFLEKASFEDPESSLCDTWATLLTSAATDFNPHMVRFCSILAEIGPSEIKYLSRLCREARVDKPLTYIQDAPGLFYPMELIGTINQSIVKAKPLAEVLKSIISNVELPGGIITFICLYRSTDKDDQQESYHDLFEQNSSGSVSLLQSLGIVTHAAFIQGQVGSVVWYGEAVSLTSFGVAFLSSCDREIRAKIKEMRDYIEKAHARAE